MEIFQRFWLIVVDVWEKGLLGIDLGRIVVAAIILILPTRSKKSWRRPGVALPFPVSPSMWRPCPQTRQRYLCPLLQTHLQNVRKM